MSIIKAGTYRWNDVLTSPSENIEQNISFRVTALGALAIGDQIRIQYNSYNGVVAVFYNITECDALVSAGVPLPFFTNVYEYTPDGTGGNGWNVISYGESVKTITIPYDQDVSDEFYEWFAVNAKVYTTISGTWIIKDIPRFDNELLEYVNFISNGKTYLAFRLHMGSTQSEIFYAYSESGADQAYIDWYYDLEGNEVLYEWSNNAYKTIEFVGEQSVSQQFVDWLTANARNAAGIDFSTLKSLTIPEGNVTQIADASGRVLWSSAPPFDGFVYLRPSADISISGISRTPSDATAAYLLINEEVSDGELTIIYMSGSLDSSGVATFSLSGNTPPPITRVTNIYVVVSADGDTNGSKDSGASRLGVNLLLDGVKYNVTYGETLGRNTFAGANYEPKTFTADGPGSDLADLCAKLNTFASQNGILPEIELEITMGTANIDNKTETYSKLSQIYVVVECE